MNHNLDDDLTALDREFRSHMLAYRTTGKYLRLQDAEDALQRMESRVQQLPERELWCTKTLALRSMIERERKTPRTDETTLQLERQDRMVDRALQRIEEARGVAADTASLLATQRERIESADARVVSIAQDSEGALVTLYRMRRQMTRNGVAVAAAACIVAAAIGSTIALLVMKSTS